MTPCGLPPLKRTVVRFVRLTVSVVVFSVAVRTVRTVLVTARTLPVGGASIRFAIDCSPPQKGGSRGHGCGCRRTDAPPRSPAHGGRALGRMKQKGRAEWPALPKVVAGLP